MALPVHEVLKVMKWELAPASQFSNWFKLRMEEEFQEDFQEWEAFEKEQENNEGTQSIDIVCKPSTSSCVLSDHTRSHQITPSYL